MTNKAVLTPQQANRNQPAPIPVGTVEEVITGRDLSKLAPAERVRYYTAVCQSVGLNPLTRPFMYVSLRGKSGGLQLYATRNATDQLRKLHHVHLEIVSKEEVDGLYVVTARASLPDGRADEDIGAVALGNARGEERANLVMKAITKAKRRVTLSICGLGWTDETEIETIPGAQIANVDPETGQMTQDVSPASAPAPHARPQHRAQQRGDRATNGNGKPQRSQRWRALAQQLGDLVLPDKLNAGLPRWRQLAVGFSDEEMGEAVAVLTRLYQALQRERPDEVGHHDWQPRDVAHARKLLATLTAEPPAAEQGDTSTAKPSTAADDPPAAPPEWYG